jgi:hypothetical protein
MKALLALIGVGASLFALMHVFGLIGALTSGGGAASQFGPTRLLAHVVGIAFGLLIAFVCFRKCAGNKPAAPAEFED